MSWEAEPIYPQLKKVWGNWDLLSLQLRWMSDHQGGFIYFQTTLLGFGIWVQYDWETKV